jgi:small subunit ribosomal protein S15
MARMHSRDKGNSGSVKPSVTQKPSWIRYNPKEIEILTVKLAKEGKTMSEIGMVLRDTYGIPSVKALTKKSIAKILEEGKLLSEIPEDLVSLIKKAIIITKHLEENRQDMTGKRGLQLTESKIKRLVKYYKGTGRIPATWKYDKETMQLFI